MWLWTPPSETSPIRCSASPRAARAGLDAARRCRRAHPTRRPRRCGRGPAARRRPAPRLRWPTSELPCLPVGQPHRPARGGQRGVRPVAPRGGRTPACAPGRRRCPGRAAASPQPSSTTSTTGPVTSRRGDDRQRTLGVEAGAADQAAVDVGLGQQLGGVLGLHAAAVLDPQRGSPVAAVEQAADEARAPPGPSPAWPSGRCRSPRPARRRRVTARVVRDGAERRSTWRAQHVPRSPPPRARLGLADGQDHLQAGVEGGGQLLGQRGVGLAEVLAPLGVAEQHAVARRGRAASPPRSRR